MTMRQRRALRTIAAGSALGLAAGTVAAIGATSPASAAELNYTCATPLGDRTFPVTINTDAPAKLPTGSTTNPRITAVQTVPAELADLMRGILQVTDASGSIDSVMTINGRDRQRPLNIPKSSIGDSGDAQLNATGRLGRVKGGAPGSTIRIGAGDQNVTMHLFKADGSPASDDPFAIPCSPAAGQNATIDTIRVVKVGSKTNAKANYKKRKKKAVVKAKVRATNGIDVNGKVKFVLKRGKKKVAAAKDTLNKRDVAKVVFKKGKVRRPGKYKVVAKYLGSNRVKKSKDVAKFRVRR